MQPHDADSLAVVGELAAIARIVPLLPSGDATLVGPGDDAAVVAAPDGRVVVTTDTMLEGADFRLDWSTWHDLGWKAAATNLSDVAAMGARPTSLVVALAVPASTLVGDLEAFARGMADAVAALAPGCGVVGGDLGTAPHAVVAVTAFGDLGGRDAVLRSGTRAGDRVVVAGTLGRAGRGLRALSDSDASGARVARDDADVTAQLRPTPPIHLGTMLADAGATSMLDVSDSLALDAHRIARASAVRIALDEGLDAVAHADGGTAIDALFGGEDHALLATMPADAALPAGVRAIGVVEPGEGVTHVGEAVPARGWDPYRA